MFDYIIPLWFFMAFFIGMFLTYISTPLPDIMIKYPTPENAGNIIYRDSADVCYKYSAEEVKCPADKTKIRTIDIQDKDRSMKNQEGLLSNILRKFS